MELIITIFALNMNNSYKSVVLWKGKKGHIFNFLIYFETYSLLLQLIPIELAYFTWKGNV